MTSDTTSPPSTAFRAAGDLRLLTWPALDASGADAAVTARSGGVSSGPYATLNLSLSVGDDPGCVLENRHRLATAFGAAPGDFDGTEDVTVGLEDVSTYPALFAELLRRGWTEPDCAALAGGNVLRALRSAEAFAAAAAGR